MGQFWTSILRIPVSRAQVLLVNPCGVFSTLICGTMFHMGTASQVPDYARWHGNDFRVHEAPCHSPFSITDSTLIFPCFFMLLCPGWIIPQVFAPHGSGASVYSSPKVRRHYAIQLKHSERHRWLTGWALSDSPLPHMPS